MRPVLIAMLTFRLASGSTARASLARKEWRALLLLSVILSDESGRRGDRTRSRRTPISASAPRSGAPHKTQIRNSSWPKGSFDSSLTLVAQDDKAKINRGASMGAAQSDIRVTKKERLPFPGSLSGFDENVGYDCEPSLRFSVGRSSSVLVSVPLPLSVEGLSAVARRSVGRSLLSLSFCTLWRFWMDARRPFTFSNSEVSTTYSGRAGRTVLISCCAAATRSGVMGWEAKAFAKVPGFFFSRASTFSKNETNDCGSYPALYMYSMPRKSASASKLRENFMKVSGTPMLKAACVPSYTAQPPGTKIRGIVARLAILLRVCSRAT